MKVKVVGFKKLINKKDGSYFFEYYCTTPEFVDDGVKTLSFLSSGTHVIDDEVHVFYSRKYNRYFASNR